MLPTSLYSDLTKWLKINIDEDCKIENILSVAGGSINESFRIETSSGNFFLKYNLASQYPLMFETELKGLDLLHKTNTVYVPQTYTVAISDKYSYLLMHFEIQVPRLRNYWEQFAQQLSSLHKVSSSQFGLDYNNYIGSLHQDNAFTNSFIEFLINRRLQPLIKSARDQNLLTASDIYCFEKLFSNLAELIPEEIPSLLHGDLWSGNLITNSRGESCLIDPAVYYGHRETDIAMTYLFGGFPEMFYIVYNETFPLVKGWQERIQLHQLYPLLVHVNLFGSGYANQIRSIIRKY